MALTRITKGVIKPNENYDTHNINSTGIITATKFVGPLDAGVSGTNANFTGIVTATTFKGNIVGTAATFTGDVSIGGTLTYEDVTNIDSVGLVTARDGVFIPDNKELKIGNTAGTPDLKIYHSSSNNNSYIEESGSGYLIAKSNRFEVTNAAGTEALINAVQDTGVSLYDGTNTVRLATTNTGATVTGKLTSTTAGIGTNNPGNTLHLGGTQGVGARWHNYTSGNSAYLTLESGDKFQSNVGGSGEYAWVSAGGTKMTLTNAGKLDITGGIIARAVTDSFTLNTQNQPHYGFNLSSSSSVPIGMSGYYGIAFATEGTERLRIQKDGKLGIGTDNPTQRITSYTASGYCFLANGPGSGIGLGNNGAIVFGNKDLGSYAKGVLDATELEFKISGTAKINIDTSGRLLVGHTSTIDTSTYNSKIQVMGTDAAASITVGRFGDNGSASSIHLTKSRNGTVGNHGSGELHDNDVIGNIFWWGSDGGDYEEVARIGVEADAAFTGSSTPGNLTFWTTQANATTATERLRISSEGDVTIKNHSAGGGLIFDSRDSTSNYSLVTGNANRASADYVLTGIRGDWNSDSVAAIYLKTGADTTNKDDGEITFHTQTSGTNNLTERLRIKSDGKIEVPTTGKLSLGMSSPVAQFTAGTANGSRVIEIQGTDGVIRGYNRNSSAWAQIDFEAASYSFDTGGSERLVINSAGVLQIKQTTNTNQGIEWYSSGGTKSASIGWGNGNANFEFKNFRQDSQADGPYGNIDFFTGSTSNPGLKMRIQVTGEIGMNGVTNPTGYLHIGGVNHFIRLGTAHLSGENSNLISDYTGNPIVSGTPWYTTSCFAYDTNNSPAMDYYWIKLVESISSSGLAYIEYVAMGDTNYPRSVRGTIEILKYANSSMSVCHDQQTAEKSTVQLVVDSNQDVWIRLHGYDWNHDFRFRSIYSEGVTLCNDFSVGTNAASCGRMLNQDASPPNASIDIIPGSNIRWALSNANPPNSYYSNDYRKFHRVNVTNNLSVTGSVSKGSGSFKIPHPLVGLSTTKDLVHSFIEGPQCDNIYRGKVDLVGGTATVNIDTKAGMSAGTFVALNRDVQCFTTNETGWTNVKGTVSGNTLTITAQDNSCTDTVSWMVVGERQDDIIKSSDLTDNDGNLIIEPARIIENLNGSDDVVVPDEFK